MNRGNLFLSALLLAVHPLSRTAEQTPLGPVEQSIFCSEEGYEDGATAAYGQAVNAHLSARAREGADAKKALVELRAALDKCKGKDTRAVASRNTSATTAQKRP